MGVEWVAVGLTLLGFLGSLINALWARNERRAAADSAALASQVQESMAESQKAIAAAVTKPPVAFVVVSGRIGQWMLKNTGTDTVTGLKVDLPKWCRFIGEGSKRTELTPGEMVTFAPFTRLSHEMREPTMRVTCDQWPDGVQVALPV